MIKTEDVPHLTLYRTCVFTPYDGRGLARVLVRRAALLLTQLRHSSQGGWSVKHIMVKSWDNIT